MTAYITSREAVDLIAEILNKKKPYVFYNALYQNKIAPHHEENGVKFFSRDEVVELANKRLESDREKLTQAQAGLKGLISTKEILDRCEAEGVPIRRNQLYKYVDTKKLVVALEAPHPGYNKYYYTEESVNRLIEYLKEQKEQKAGMYTAREAVEYLRNKGVETSLDTFYHWLHRGLLSGVALSQGASFQYYFSPETLDAFAEGVINNTIDSSDVDIPLIELEDTEELRRLEEKYGRLVTSRKAREITKLSTAGFSARLSRKVIRPVARFGSTLLFPVSQLREPKRAPVPLLAANS